MASAGALASNGLELKVLLWSIVPWVCHVERGKLRYGAWRYNRCTESHSCSIGVVIASREDRRRTSHAPDSATEPATNRVKLLSEYARLL